MVDEMSAPFPDSGSGLGIARAGGGWRGLPRAALPIMAALLIMSVLAALGEPAGAAGRERLAQRAEPRISVPSAIVAGPASQSALPIQVGGSVPGNSFLRVRGLPHSVSLTEGYSIGPGSWAVPLYVLPSLKVNVPAGIAGRAEITITLVGVDGTLLTEAQTLLVVAPAAAALAPPERSAEQPPPAAQRPLSAARPERVAPRAPEMPAEERERARSLMAQGERYLSQGNIEIARQYFKRAADAGFGPAALKLAATYDPVELSHIGAQGVVPDRTEARKWYERARELGAPEATDRLARLGSGG